MHPVVILMVGSQAAGALEARRRLEDLGHEVVAADDMIPLACQPGDVILLAAPADSAVMSELQEDPRPLLVVAAPTRGTAALPRRPGGLVIMTGRESDDGYRLAMSLCTPQVAGLVMVAAP